MSRGPPVVSPVVTPSPVLAASPQFSALLSSLTEKHINADTGLRHETTAALEDARAALQRAKRGYLRQKTLVDTLQGMVEDAASAGTGSLSMLQSTVHGGTSSVPLEAPARMYDVLGRCLACARASECVVVPGTEDAPVHLGGITREFIAMSVLPGDAMAANPDQAAAETAAELAEMRCRLLPELEARLVSAAASISRFYHAEDTPTGDAETRARAQSLAVAKAAQLPATLARVKAQVEDAPVAALRARIMLEETRWETHGVLTDKLGLLVRIIRDYKLDAQPRTDAIASAFSKARIRALAAKLRVLKLRVMCAMYTADTVPVLRRIHAELAACLEKAQMDLADAKARSAAYDAVGGDFGRIVSDYADTLQDIDNKLWALNELQGDDRFRPAPADPPQ